ncbi:hypothetical protein C9J48_17685 [Photobacterium profundum]|uniref:Type 4 fimbrial biogenesis protein PilX N-terminal domain-containing protein n=1 Tax=Photobacterium profundum 3TCK TaxID=314280 RepID=Q1Z2Z1_9GAMM|nr:hypothetical protein [Photobacterium profundum]EAS42998.1 hypothetical protein P3TCK_14323 [Photobacterium profundum 3TCK]PSV60965.1 hypothetical protein C9J48_17685 [Photobacterium profundum]
MNSQKGMATLLVTAMLLVVSLLFSLASYKNVFYQIKRTQNEVLARQAHWLAEGGLECGFAKINEESDLSLVTNSNYFYTDCNASGNSIEIDTISSDMYVITSRNTNDIATKKISKHFSIAGGRSPGIIKATSNLLLEGTTLMYPDPGVKSEGEYECVIARYAGNVEIKGTLTNAGLHHAYPPYDGFHSNSTTWPKCKPENQSIVADNKIVIGSSKPSVFGDDYIYSANLDPFKDVFHVPRKDWEKIKDKSTTTVIAGSLSCSSDIASKIAVDSDRIWVVGNCDLGSNANLIQEAITIAGIPGIVLVVQDGILAVNGAQTLSALIYHFKSPGSTFMPTESQWDVMSAGGQLTHQEKLVVGYFQFGAFHPKGGYVMDAPGLTAKIRGSLDFSFNSDVFKDALDDLETISWVEGSWYDL